MGIIYNERMNEDEYYNKNTSYKKKENKKNNYTYDLKVVREKSYRSTSVDLNINKSCNEKCVDIQMDEIKYTRIFGTVKDLEGNIAKNTRVTLFRAKLINYKTHYIPVCDMITDERGMYEAVVDDDYGQDHYIVKVEDE